jgi:hypothetical protein
MGEMDISCRSQTTKAWNNISLTFVTDYAICNISLGRSLVFYCLHAMFTCIQFNEFFTFMRFIFFNFLVVLLFKCKEVQDKYKWSSTLYINLFAKHMHIN